MAKEWFTAQELVGLPGMPGTERRVRSALQKNLAVIRNKTRGKGLEFAFKSLPAATQQHLYQQTVAAVLADLPALPPPQVASALAPIEHPGAAQQTSQQRAVADARQAVLRAVRRLQNDAGVTQRRAMLTFLTQAAAGQLQGDVAAAMLELARDSRGRKGTSINAKGLPTLRTLQGWTARAEVALQGDNLAPRIRLPDMTVKPWMLLALEIKRRPQKPATSEVVKEMEKVWGDYTKRWVQEQLKDKGSVHRIDSERVAQMAALLKMPTYDMVSRFFREQFSQLDLLKGQHLGSALRSHQLSHPRTSAGLLPWYEIHADGWNTHFTAPHPVNGEYMTHEVWHFHDVATRYTLPFSVGLTESAEVILRGLELCVRFGGVPLFLQTDSTGSVKNDKFEFDPVASLSARAGMTVVHPKAVGNSQANGIAENYNKYLDKKSKALATYQHQSMDTLAHRNVRKFTAQMVKARNRGDGSGYQNALDGAVRVGKGVLFETHGQMVEWLETIREEGNNTPHSALPKMVDSVTGKYRHQTPQEALTQARADGWQPELLPESTLVDLFRPHVRKTVRRETVSAYNKQRYHHPCLGDYNGEPVIVAFDLYDGHRVWVKDFEGRLICEAQYVEVTGYRCLSSYEDAMERRMKAQIRLRTQSIEAIEDRMNPSRAPLEVLAIERQEAVILPMPMPMPQATDIAMYLFQEQMEQEDRESRESHNAQKHPMPTGSNDPWLELLMREEREREREEAARESKEGEENRRKTM